MPREVCGESGHRNLTAKALKEARDLEASRPEPEMVLTEQRGIRLGGPRTGLEV